MWFYWWVSIFVGAILAWTRFDDVISIIVCMMVKGAAKLGSTIEKDICGFVDFKPFGFTYCFLDVL